MEGNAVIGYSCTTISETYERKNYVKLYIVGGRNVTATLSVFGKSLGKSRVCEVGRKVLCQIYAKGEDVGCGMA